MTHRILAGALRVGDIAELGLKRVPRATLALFYRGVRWFWRSRNWFGVNILAILGGLLVVALMWLAILHK